MKFLQLIFINYKVIRAQQSWEGDCHKRQEKKKIYIMSADQNQTKLNVDYHAFTSVLFLISCTCTRSRGWEELARKQFVWKRAGRLGQPQAKYAPTAYNIMLRSFSGSVTTELEQTDRSDLFGGGVGEDRGFRPPLLQPQPEFPENARGLGRGHAAVALW